jgi:flagellar M-ring protein FliF
MEQLKKLISGLNVRQRISIVVAAVLVVAGIVSFVHWKHEADFRPLYTSMAAEDAATVVQKLRESGVEYRLGDNGSSVMVPAAKLAESRLTLAAAGLPKTGRIGFELFDKTNFGATEFVERINYQRALEGELERSVMSLAEVEQARVHITFPKESVFLDQQQPAKASVMLKLRAGSQMSQQNVQAVVHLVSSAVENLSPDAVSVLDMDGHLLSRPKRAAADDGSEGANESLEVRQRIENNLVAKINATLEPLLGLNGFRAAASVDYDLTSGEQQEETLDPSRSVMLSSQKTEDVSERAGPSGIPGTASNLPAPPPRPASGNSGVSRRTENITYQTSRVIRHTKIPQGIVRRMSLAVLVDQPVRWEGSGASRHRVLTTPSPETLKSIRDLVAGVTGFNADRGDQLVVETLPFEASWNAQPPASLGPSPKPQGVAPQWLEKYRDLLLPAAVAFAVLLVFVRGIFKFGRRRKEALDGPEIADRIESGFPAPSLSDSAISGQLPAPSESPEEDHRELAERIRRLAQGNAGAAANVLRMWLHESQSETETV